VSLLSSHPSPPLLHCPSLSLRSWGEGLYRGYLVATTVGLGEGVAVLRASTGLGVFFLLTAVPLAVAALNALRLEASDAFSAAFNACAPTTAFVAAATTTTRSGNTSSSSSGGGSGAGSLFTPREHSACARAFRRRAKDEQNEKERRADKGGVAKGGRDFAKGGRVPSHLGSDRGGKGRGGSDGSGGSGGSGGGVVSAEALAASLVSYGAGARAADAAALAGCRAFAARKAAEARAAGNDGDEGPAPLQSTSSASASIPYKGYSGPGVEMVPRGGATKWGSLLDDRPFDLPQQFDDTVASAFRSYSFEAAASAAKGSSSSYGPSVTPSVAFAPLAAQSVQPGGQLPQRLEPSFGRRPVAASPAMEHGADNGAGSGAGVQFSFDGEHFLPLAPKFRQAAAGSAATTADAPTLLSAAMESGGGAGSSVSLVVPLEVCDEAAWVAAHAPWASSRGRRAAAARGSAACVLLWAATVGWCLAGAALFLSLEASAERRETSSWADLVDAVGSGARHSVSGGSSGESLGAGGRQALSEAVGASGCMVPACARFASGDELDIFR